MPSSAQQAPSRLSIAASDIKLAHSVFALPFAILGAALAADFSASVGTLTLQLVLIVACMVAARTWAMLINRLADHKLDADNPRTAKRAIASGRLAYRDGWLIAIASALGFCILASLFWPLLGNPWPTYLCIPVLGFIALYSYTKRFTALCHVFLGAALALSPVAAVIAIDPAYLTQTPAVWCIAGFVLLWVAGFDIIYALQDLEYDQSVGLHSVPAKLGWSNAIWVSRAMHLAAFVSLAFAWHTEPRLTYVFLFAGLAPVAGLLVAEHAVLAQRGKAGLDMAFFTLNGIASVLLGLAGLADIFF
ncbi:MAG: 4-hydroxybenzoate octaprenyltransferase [Phycisphaera sp.]|nr:MAG: 4-hydroxybenzoate octaprenyltransferase [Phycisphaera sp.]